MAVPQCGTEDAIIKVLSDENPEHQGSTFKAWVGQNMVMHPSPTVKYLFL